MHGVHDEMSKDYRTRRSWIRPKKRVRKVSWRTGRVREDAAGMARLRSEAFHRSCGLCECGRAACLIRSTRERLVTWADGHLHHVVSRARGGSDVLENVQFITRRCHREITGELHWGIRVIAA
jgi:5-methylcytosine-specific restriction endonuclease McrA